MFLLVAAALVAITVTPVLADHDWASGCSNGNTCWSEVNYGGGYMQSDHRDSYTNNDYYASGTPPQTIGFQTDYFRNKMNVTHAHVYRNQSYSSELFCVNPGSSVWYYVGGTTSTSSWLGHGGSLGWCRS